MQHSEMICACTIAGSDSGGGAGLQADLKTFSALGVWGLTVVTAVTAQNTREVRESWVLEPRTVRVQLEAVLDDFAIGACKTGMLGNAGVIREVVRTLPPGIPLVVDPVMISTSGYPLIDRSAVEELIRVLVPRATLITPNVPEACALTGRESLTTSDDIREAGEQLLDLGAGAVLIKGGHRPGETSVDVFIGREEYAEFSGPRYPFDVHGSGCCLSAAITAFIAKGLSPKAACEQAKPFIDAAISHAARAGSGVRVAHPLYQLFANR
jgi:hydroxymethylpyrimidine/phosphomethylpyrimidine kinase